MSFMQKTLSSTVSFLRMTVCPLLLISLCPPLIFLFWYTNYSLDGSLLKLWSVIESQGFFSTIYTVWAPYFFGSTTAWKILALFAAIQLLFMRLLPGKTFKGPITPAGNVPIYRANGPQTYFITLFLFVFCSFQLKLFKPTILYDHFPEILGALNLFSFIFCIFLVLKGRYYPSSTDCGSSHHAIFDFYWGTELYPRIAGCDIKMFTNCRFAMMGWPLLIISFAAKQNELYGLSNSMVIAVTLQLIYITKFFFWETGYLRSLDIMHDRAGFYICWGCLVWVPAIYTSPTFYLVNHPNHLSLFWMIAILVLGTASILINFWADKQRQHFRSLEGKCTIWGKEPRVVVAKFTTTDGQDKENLLLASGWWGVARHFHYVPEILGAFFWSVPALFTHFIPYFYVIFLTVLLVERAFRDEKRCALKYGDDWDTYCQAVPYKIIPYTF